MTDLDLLRARIVSACECAPGKPGTYPTSRRVTGSRSITAVNVFMTLFFHIPANSQTGWKTRPVHELIGRTEGRIRERGADFGLGQGGGSGLSGGA